MSPTPLPRRFPKWVSPRLHAGPSRIAGQGVFTHEPVSAGEVLMRWGRIPGLDWRLPELQVRYRQHFLPCLNRLIEATR